MKNFLALFLSLLVAIPAYADAPLIWSAKNSAKLLNSGDLVANDGNTYQKYFEKNYIKNHSGAIDTTGWTATGTATIARTTTNGSRASLGYALQFAVGAASDYVRYRYTVDAADQGKKLKIAFDLKPTAYTSNDWQVDNYCTSDSTYATGLTRKALSTDASAISGLPNLTGTYRTTFDSDTTSIYCELRLTRAAGSSTIALSDIVVGPGVVTQGAAVSQWQTLSGVSQFGSSNSSAFTNTTLTEAMYRRVGDSMDIEIVYTFTGTPGTGTGQFTIQIAGFNLDTSKWSNSIDREPNAFVTGSSNKYGFGTNIANSGSNMNLSFAQVAGNTSVGAAGSGGGFQPSTIPVTLANGSTFTVHLTGVPVVAWAGGGAINVLQNDCEYAANSDVSATATVTTGTVYGPAGVNFPSSNWVLGTKWTRRVQWLTPISATDRIMTEFDEASSGAQWAETAGYAPATAANGTRYGIAIEGIGSNYVDIGFESGGLQNGAATYGVNGTAWTTQSAIKWRAKKCAGGQAVGLANVTQTASGTVKGAGQLLGTNTNDAACAGCVGEVKTISLSQGSGFSLTTGNVFNFASSDGNTGGTNKFTLTAGDWDIRGICHFEGGSSGTVISYAECATSGTSQTEPSYSTSMGSPNNSGYIASVARWNSGGPFVYELPITPYQVTIANGATQDFYLIGQLNWTTSTAAGNGFLQARRVR